MSAGRGVPALDPTLNRAFAELVLVAEADRDVNARPHSGTQVLGYARAARRYATARCWPECVSVLQQLVRIDGEVETALTDKVRSCAGALVAAARVNRIELVGVLVLRATDVAVGRPELTAVPTPRSPENTTEQEETTA